MNFAGHLRKIKSFQGSILDKLREIYNLKGMLLCNLNKKAKILREVLNVFSFKNLHKTLKTKTDKSHFTFQTNQ